MVTFLGRVGNLITWDELVTFLGRDGHRLTNLANLKYWGDAFCNYWGGWGPIIGGDIYPPSPPVSAPLYWSVIKTQRKLFRPHNSVYNNFI